MFSLPTSTADSHSLIVVLLSLVLLISWSDCLENDTKDTDELFDNVAHTENSKPSEMLFRLSINQSEEGMGKLLVKIDQNNDQIISLVELTDWILKSNDNIEEKEAKMYISQFDRDNDSSVSWAEYLEHYYGSPTLEFANTNPDHQEILDFVEADKVRFHSADKNKDGVLTLSELKAFLHPHNHGEMLDYEAMKLLKDYDMNNDSKISKEELIHIQYGGIQINPLQTIRINRIFENYDVDKDGSLDLEEIKMWLKPDVVEYAKTEAIHLIKVSDTDHDSKVTKDEILSSLEHWMSSKATNFGDHVRDEL